MLDYYVAGSVDDILCPTTVCPSWYPSIIQPIATIRLTLCHRTASMVARLFGVPIIITPR